MSKLEFVVSSAPLDFHLYGRSVINDQANRYRERGHTVEWNADARVLSVEASSFATADNLLRELLNEMLILTLDSRGCS
jgi:hypothetical protein